MFIEQLTTNPTVYFSWIVLVMFSICCHEYAHAYTALRFGDDTAARNGHLSLNPLVQMGTQSLIILALFGLAWGAVPISSKSVRHAYQQALIALAGPLTNLLLCLLFALLLVIAKTAGASLMVADFLFIGGAVNGVLFIFNILPIPMLDGFSVVSAFHPGMQTFAQKYAAPLFFGFILLLWSTSLGSVIFGTGNILLRNFVHLWSGLVGLFL